MNKTVAVFPVWNHWDCVFAAYHCSIIHDEWTVDFLYVGSDHSTICDAGHDAAFSVGDEYTEEHFDF